MATTERQWYVGEDGCISIGENASYVTYHSALNSIIVSTKEPSIKIYDVASGALLQKSDLSATSKDAIKCIYLAEKDKIVFCDEQAVGARSDLRGMLLLDTALQTPVSTSDDEIKVEIPLAEASQLLKSLLSASLEGVDYVEEVVKELEKKVEVVQEATKGHLKTAKWATVCLEVAYTKLKVVCTGLVQEMKKLLVYSPGLSVASSISDRLSYLLPNSLAESGSGPVERAMMYSELARQETFRKWPHMNYKWALPDPMSQAGFYHQPNSVGDDRAMCFTCNVCLVCWEPTDEPWSEHERHSPACPFVKGEYTQNVPLCVTYGSQPAKKHGEKKDKIECLSTTAAEDFVATSTLNGNIVVWNVSKMVKKHCQFNLDPAEPIIAMRTGFQIDRQSGKKETEVSPDKHRGSSSTAEEVDAGLISFSIQSDGSVTALETKSNGTTTEIQEGDSYELPSSKQESPDLLHTRTRPCDDVKVKSMCIVMKPSSEKVVKDTSSKSKKKSRTKHQPTLICGTSLRRTRVSLSNKDVQNSSSNIKTEEVQLMNKVNKVVSEETPPKIINEEERGSLCEDFDEEDILNNTCFIPHLIVAAVRDDKRRLKHKEKEVKKTLTSSTSVGNLSAVPTLGSISMNHGWGILDPMFDSDQDPDVQIVGVTPGPASLSVESPVTTKGKSITDSESIVSQVQPSQSHDNVSTSSSTNKSSKVKAGSVLQCIELPMDLRSEQLEISVICPTLDRQHLVVIVSPVQCKTGLVSSNPSVISASQGVVTNNFDESVELHSNGTSITTPSSSVSDVSLAKHISHPGGCILIYKYRYKEEYAELDENPVVWKYIDNVREAVTSVLVLPQDFSDYQEREEESHLSVCRSDAENSKMTNGEQIPEIHGQIAVTLSNGNLWLMKLSDLSVLVEICPPEEGDKFVSATYCTGMERLCACSDLGKLHIYQLCEECPVLTEPSTPGDIPDGVINGAGLHDLCASSSVVESSDSRETLDRGSPGSDILAKQPLSMERLSILHNLIQFENLMPRFTATVPSCWTEIQQEQQQRRHPQHLQHQGEATQHTRTWKLQPDSNTWDEHLFEIVLPRPCCVGHVDVKFNLHPMCTSPPDVQVTLLKQNITSLGRQPPSPNLIDVDRGIDFSISSDKPAPEPTTSSEQNGHTSKISKGNNVLEPAFQERHNAEVLCGPISISSCLDLSGNGGLITLTSPQLLSSKPKAFLLHVKGFPSQNDEKNNEKHKEMKKKVPTTATNTAQKMKVMKTAFDNDLFIPPSKVKDTVNASLPRTKFPDNLKGCDWIQELSVTIRKTKKTHLPKERLQRNTMIEHQPFHERLIAAVALLDDFNATGVCVDHYQNMALDVLMWITSIQVNDPTNRVLSKSLSVILKPCLEVISKACFIQGTRTTAHKCARLLALCMEQCKQLVDPDLAPSFSYSLLHALLDTMTLLPHANFSGSVRWFFTMLNRVKCMDIGKVAKRCSELIMQMSKQYNERMSPLHSLLKSRFGLYGHPFDPDLFDTDLPVALRQSTQHQSIPTTQNGSSSSSSGNNNNNMTSSPVTVIEELDYYDLFNPPNDRSSKVQLEYAKSNIFGLLEVEPLHFTCHSTSDGTKMERMDQSVSGHSSYMNNSSLSGTINFGEMIPPQASSGTSASTLASLSSGMAMAKQHLHELSTKSYPTFKHKILHIKKIQSEVEKTLPKILSDVGKTGPPEGLVKHSTSSDHLLPPTPKTTPQVMTPPLTPPNETWTQGSSSSSQESKGDNNKHFSAKSALGSLPNAQTLLQQPPLQVLVIERMHSGARRFVILDFGKPIVLTDVVIPACQDLASLSIDVWVQGEEVDGQRFVVASDIGMRSLIMNDIMPSLVCRYLKITTIGRYGTGSTRSKIPIGAFYGHSCILPWEWNSYLEQRSTPSAGGQLELPTQSQLMAQLGIYVSLLEDIQCRYSLARNRLEMLLSGLDSHQYPSAHVQYYLMKNRKSSDDDNKIFQAYHDCLQLQHQLNLAQRATDRLQQALGFKESNEHSMMSVSTGSQSACTDKLRFLQECVLEVLLSTTTSSPSIPQPPVSLFEALSPQVAEMLFQNLCIHGSKKIQISAGLLLMRVCGGQPWWGNFLGNILQEYFHSENTCIFSQDRVFVLLVAMGQKALSGPRAVPIMESLLDILARVLSPLIQSQQAYLSQSGMIDLTLVGWILLFLCRNIDHTTLNSDDTAKAARKDNGSTMPNRWNFIQGDHNQIIGSATGAKVKATKLIKGSRLSMQKRLLHHKQKLMDLQQAQKTFFSSHAEKNAQNTSNALLKQQEKQFRKELSQYASKHIKDIIQMRRTEVEALRKMTNKPENGSDSDKSSCDEEQEGGLVLAKDKTLRVVKGLMALLLNMDFTCNVDLFLVTCKVFATICVTTRPAITLAEAMSQEQLEKLILLAANLDFSHGNISWGGPWAGHAITCLLQDILDGEKFYPAHTSMSTDESEEALGFTTTETDESLPNSISLPQMEETEQDTEPNSLENPGPADVELSESKDSSKMNFDKESSLMVDLLLDEGEYDDDTSAKLHAYVTGESMVAKSPPETGQIPLYDSSGVNGIDIVTYSAEPEEKKIGFLKKLSKKNQEMMMGKENWNPGSSSAFKPSQIAVTQGMSTAVDARLEYGLETQAELRLKVMLSLHTEGVQQAFTSALPIAPSLSHGLNGSTSPSTDDFVDTNTSVSAVELSSSEMMSQCYENLFNHLQPHCTNLDALLQLWLTLNGDSQSDGSTGVTNFDPSHVPLIPLSPSCLTNLLTVLTSIPSIPICTWVMALQTLTLLANQRVPSNTGDVSMVICMLSDPNLMAVIKKFLSGTSDQGPVSAAVQFAQVGPSASKCFYEFLLRLLVKCPADSLHNLKELMLKLVYTLCAERGAFHSGLGPLDAQCKFMAFILENTYENVDISNAISVIESISTLVHQHILCQERVTCRSSSENSINARSCFGGLFASLLRGGDSRSTQGDCSRDLLMCSLLKLINNLIQIRVNPPRSSRLISVGLDTTSSVEPQTPSNLSMSEAVPDSTKLVQALATSTPAVPDSTKLVQALATSTPAPPIRLSDEEKGGQTDEQKTENLNMQSDPTTYIADIILGHRHVMCNLIQALSFCNSNTMAMILGSKGLTSHMQDTFTGGDPISVGDGIYQILVTLTRHCSDQKLMLESLYLYLSESSLQGIHSQSVSRLSEPLLWFILKVLDSPRAINMFMTMGGIHVICRSLVSCNSRIISTNPSLISTIIKNLNGRGRPVLESDSGLQNFAPLGTISSSSPTASPAEVLIQAAAPHRRARSAAWSYHFYPDEAWVDLTIQLPFAILLKEVQIQPHNASLTTCPAYVSVEISHDGVTTTPLCTPLMTSSLAFIKLQLQRPEIATVITVRLHKARDSMTIGLSQVLLMGYSAFGDNSTAPQHVLLPNEDYVSRSSVRWIRLLHHCLTEHKEVEESVAAAASTTPNLLNTCSSLLVSPVSSVYVPNIEEVLLKLGLHSVQMGLLLIDNILRSSHSHSNIGLSAPYLGKVSGHANDSTTELLYQLGIVQDSGTQQRVETLLQWLGDSARMALQRSAVYSDDGYRRSPRETAFVSLPSPAPIHIQCVSAVLWRSHELPVEYNLQRLISRDLVSSLYEWSIILKVDSNMKKAVDYVLCSICHISPEYFSQILIWMGVIVTADNSIYAPISDDRKDNSSFLQTSMTDDSKEANTAQGQTVQQNGLVHIPPVMMQDFRHMTLDESHLATLALTCKSPVAIKELLESSFPAVLAQGLFEFCNKVMLEFSETCIHPEGMTDTTKTMCDEGMPSGSVSSASSSSEKSLWITADLVAPVLQFLAEISSEPQMKEWLGGAEGNIFWPALLTMLCNTPAQSAVTTKTTRRHEIMSVDHRAAIETAAVTFFTQVMSCHFINQLLFAKVLCEVIKEQSSSTKSGQLLGSFPLSGFTRCLFLQALLEDEKVLVVLHGTGKMARSLRPDHPIDHPKYCNGRDTRTVIVSLHTTVSELKNKVAGHFLEKATAEKSDESKKDLQMASPYSSDMADYISSTVAGMAAKEKREKEDKSSSSGAKYSLPPRPPTRRGGRSTDSMSCSLSSSIQMFVTSLYHKLLPNKPLPDDLSLCQLLQILQQRGFHHGQNVLEFNLKHELKKKDVSLADQNLPEDWSEEEEDIPDEALLSIPPFPTALQVFASVGGLALLAEHLPLLYPEVSRQSSIQDPTNNGYSKNLTNSTEDWVTVEPFAEDFYEHYELLSPAPHVSKNANSGISMPTIPPHSLVAFGLFLRLPGYAEVLLKERKKAQCLLRLVLGVKDDGDGGHILTSPIASSLPTLPFLVLKSLYDTTPLTTDDGMVLRRMSLDIWAIHLILACLSVLSHHAPRVAVQGFQQEAQLVLSAMQTANSSTTIPISNSTEEKSQQYWAKGTGFGTGSTISNWDAEQALLRQKSEEEHVACLLQVLASYINPGGDVPKNFDDAEFTFPSEKSLLPGVMYELLSQSCLIPAISSYLRNDSVLDMARHIPLYHALLELLRGIAICPSLVPLLLPLDKENNPDSATSVGVLLDKMRGCVDTYASRLKSNKGKNGDKEKESQSEGDENEGLALLIPNIQETAKIVKCSVDRMQKSTVSEDESNEGKSKDSVSPLMKIGSEELYMQIMKDEQFDTFELVVDDGNTLKFPSPHHYENNIKAAGDVSNPARTRRLAQEAVTLSTSLPLSGGSSVFVRCDEERLDVMKVLITGPSETPYANGCFEFDVYFPQDYPNSPPHINLETTGHHIIRFNPNLYNDGKVCLSVLNTWHGRPEEKWNAQTSSFLQVLVSIQSLILVAEPYFNEPGYERSRGSPAGTASSREYDANIRQATVKWAMLEQIRSPSPCLKSVVHKHFWLKRHEVLKQCEDWIKEMESYSSDKRTGRTVAHSTLSLKRHYNQLREEFAKMKPPEGLEHLADSNEIDPKAVLYSTDSALSTSLNNVETAVAGTSSDGSGVTDSNSNSVLEDGFC